LSYCYWSSPLSKIIFGPLFEIDTFLSSLLANTTSCLFFSSIIASHFFKLNAFFSFLSTFAIGCFNPFLKLLLLVLSPLSLVIVHSFSSFDLFLVVIVGSLSIFFEPLIYFFVLFLEVILFVVGNFDLFDFTLLLVLVSVLTSYFLLFQLLE